MMLIFNIFNRVIFSCSPKRNTILIKDGQWLRHQFCFRSLTILCMIQWILFFMRCLSFSTCKIEVLMNKVYVYYLNLARGIHPINGSPPRALLPLRRHLAVSGNIFGCKSEMLLPSSGERPEMWLNILQ